VFFLLLFLESLPWDQVRRWRLHRRSVFSKRNTAVSRFLLSGPAAVRAPQCGGAAIFGKLPIVLRAFGVFERVILSLLLYGWLVRFFRVKDAALAAMVTMVISTGDVADPVSSYNHFTIMLAIASGFRRELCSRSRPKKACSADHRVFGRSFFRCYVSHPSKPLGSA